MGVNERTKWQLKNNKMKADNFNPNQLPSWPATFCVCNIILAISSTILVTHALVLNKANESCFEKLVEGEDCTGIIPSCTLEKALLIAKKFLFCYAIFIGFNSVFWMIFSCCKSHTRKQGTYFADCLPDHEKIFGQKTCRFF